MVRETGFIKRAPRKDARQAAVLIDAEGVEQQVTVLNVSAEGFKLKVPKTPRIGSRVKLRLAGQAAADAQIRWALGDQAGGVILDPSEEMPR